MQMAMSEGSAAFQAASGLPSTWMAADVNAAFKVLA